VSDNAVLFVSPFQVGAVEGIDSFLHPVNLCF
jgi:hypothetical protein